MNNWYHATVSKASVKTVEDGGASNFVLELEFKVDGYPKCLTCSILLQHPNGHVETMAFRELAAFTYAVGLNSLQDSKDLIGRRLLIGVNSAKNKVVGYRQTDNSDFKSDVESVVIGKEGLVEIFGSKNSSAKPVPSESISYDKATTVIKEVVRMDQWINSIADDLATVLFSRLEHCKPETLSRLKVMLGGWNRQTRKWKW